MAKQKTTEEIREEFVKHVWNMIAYWDQQVGGEADTRRKMEGLAFSILSTLDGSSASLPGFIVAPHPHEDDKEYMIQNGEDYYPYNDSDDVVSDIGGSLHEVFYDIGKKYGYVK